MFLMLGIIAANASVTQVFTQGIGLPDGKNAMPTTPTEYTASDTNIKYTLSAAYTNSGYLMLNGKDNDGAFVSFALDFDCSTIAITTTSGCSTNANNKVNFYANGTLVQEGVAVNVVNSTIDVAVPADYQKAGTVYKFQYDKPASGSSYNSQFASFTYYAVGETPETPEVPEPGEILTVAEALTLINGGNIPSGSVQVKGIISAIDEISPSYGNATYDIKDALTDATALKVFRGKWLNGANFTDENQLQVGGKVVVEGTLTLYNGTTPEVNTGNKLISYEAPEGGGDTPVTPPVDDEDGTATFDFTKDAYGMPNNKNDYVSLPYSFTKGAVTITLDGSGNAWRMWDDGLRQYRNNSPTFTVSVNGGKVTKVEWTYVSGVKVTQDGNDVTTTGWTGSEESVTFSTSTSTGNNAFKTITVTYEGGEVAAVAAPKISCEDNKVTITCETPDAEIYFSMDGSTPSKSSATSYKYSGPVDITETVTVKAIAYVGTDESAVTTYTAKYVGNYTGFESFVAGGSGTSGTIDGPITAVYQNGQYLYVVDSNKYPMLVYGNISQTLANGDQIADVTGTYSPYNGLPELTNPTLGQITPGGTPVEPEVIAAEELSADMVNMYVQFDNMTLSSATEMFDSTGKVALYSRFTGVEIPTDLDKAYTVTGFVAVYNTTVQVYPVEFKEIDNGKETVAAPVFNPAGGAIAAGTNVTITTATEGASIFYTTDGTEPTITSTEYKGAITVNSAMTIKAIAVKENWNNSRVVTASYTILDPNATKATFNWTDEAWLTSEGVSLPTDASTGTDIAGSDFTVEAITIAFPANDASNKARIWRLTANSGGGVQLRVFAGDNFTLSAAENYAITGITFDCDATYQNFDVAEGSEGTLTTDGVWTPASDTGAKSVTFAPSKASRVNAITVTYKNTSAVNGIVGDDSNAPVEYYNLQGVRVSNPTAGQLYIVRQGNTVTKTIVR